MPRPPEDLTDRRSGRLVAYAPTARRTKRGHVFWWCKCDCGGYIEVSSSDFKKEHVQSCGCLYETCNLRHGHSRPGRESREYRAWVGAKSRCEYQRHRSYKDYGGRGIRVCDAWSNSFDAFLKDMGPHPGAGYSIERKDNMGDYTPANCVWADKATQMRNRRTVAKLTIDGVTKTIIEWSLESGVQRQTIKMRLAMGRTPRQAVYDPLNVRRYFG